MPVPQGFQNAKLQIEGGDTIQCAFNPETYTISKTNVWTYKPNQSKDWPDPEFGGGMPMTYKLSLLLDTSLQGPDQTVKDQANALMKAMHGGGSAPKFVTFSWGSNKLPKAAPLSISIQYALFHPNGDPMRAFVDLELAPGRGHLASRAGAEPDHAGHGGTALPHRPGRRLAALDRL